MKGIALERSVSPRFCTSPGTEEGGQLMRTGGAYGSRVRAGSRRLVIFRGRTERIRRRKDKKSAAGTGSVQSRGSAFVALVLGKDVGEGMEALILLYPDSCGRLVEKGRLDILVLHSKKKETCIQEHDSSG